MLVGLIDPSHTERKRDRPGRLPNWIPLDQLLVRSAQEEPRWSPWTYEMLKAALDEQQQRDYYSTTFLLSACPRAAIIERKEDYLDSVDGLYAALRGTQIHRTLEHTARPGSAAEARFYTTVYANGQDLTLSCSPDLVTSGPEATLFDYKVTENPPVYDYPWASHKFQLQFNRYIVNHAERWDSPDGDLPWNPRELVMKHLVAVYLGPKWPKPLELMKTAQVTLPSGTKAKRKVPDVWSDAEVLKEMVPRLDIMSKALDAYPEWPEGAEEIWGGEPTWKCPGRPICNLPNCLAARWPNSLIWKPEG